MNWKVLLLSLFVTPLLATEALLDISININGTTTEIFNATVSDDIVTEIEKNGLAVLIRTLPEMNKIDSSCDLAIEITLSKGEKVISEPSFYLRWDEESIVEVRDEQSGYLTIEVIASQK